LQIEDEFGIGVGQTQQRHRLGGDRRLALLQQRQVLGMELPISIRAKSFVRGITRSLSATPHVVARIFLVQVSERAFEGAPIQFQAGGGHASANFPSQPGKRRHG
jgi:hypothetical protein